MKENSTILNDNYPVYESLGVSLDGKSHEDLLDSKIAKYVNILRKNGVYTYESCQGGEGHAFSYPTIRFRGDQYEGYRALYIALSHDFPVDQLNRFWSVIDEEIVGPDWEITLYLT